jgi:hypothetical protein
MLEVTIVVRIHLIANASDCCSRHCSWPVVLPFAFYTQAAGTGMAPIEEISTMLPATRATAASGCPRKAVNWADALPSTRAAGELVLNSRYPYVCSLQLQYKNCLQQQQRRPPNDKSIGLSKDPIYCYTTMVVAGCGGYNGEFCSVQHVLLIVNVMKHGIRNTSTN